MKNEEYIMIKHLFKVFVFIVAVCSLSVLSGIDNPVLAEGNTYSETQAFSKGNEAVEELTLEEKVQIEDWANELEYILTTLFVKGENGKYQPTADFYYSTYTQEEKEGIARLVMAINGDELLYNENPVFRSGFTDWAARCYRDTFNIGSSVAKEIATEVEKGNYLGAASKLFIATKIAGAVASHPMVSVAAAAVYLSFCGAPTVS